MHLSNFGSIGQSAVATHLIAAMANGKTRLFDIVEYFDFIMSLKTLTRVEWGGGGGGGGGSWE